MTFIYKIHSSFDGFTPSKIPVRLRDKRFLTLRWKKYLDSVEKGHQVWVFFYGPHAFTPGVYAKGVVASIVYKSKTVRVRIRKHDESKPLTTKKVSDSIRKLVSSRLGQQVFVLPENWRAPFCTIGSVADSCAKRRCTRCRTWKNLPIIRQRELTWPPRLPEDLYSYSPAYWVIPSRCFLGRRAGRLVKNTSDMFRRFKSGEKGLAFPLALGIATALRRSHVRNFDRIVPIPLSPDKIRARELNRTRVLAKELGRLIHVRVLDGLRLRHPISKRRLFRSKRNRAEFHKKYCSYLRLKSKLKRVQKILLLDDVCTEGNTLRAVVARIQSENPECHIHAATAGQMILKSVVRRRRILTKSQ